jgi:hypothetical protein
MESFGLDYYIGHGIFVGWVEHPDIFYQPFFTVSKTQQNGRR